MDLLRGFAVLGILILNIQMFSMPMAAYFNPLALGPPSTSDFAIWSINYLLADSKFMTIFSVLFGAGVLLMTTRIAERGGRPAYAHYRRMGWLLVFGLLHAYLLWYGDILVLYAVCGLFVYHARRFTPRTQCVTGLGLLAVGSLIWLTFGLTINSAPPDVVEDMRAFWSPDAAGLAREMAAFQGGWFAQTPLRTAYSRDMHLFELWVWGIWRAGGLMLVGMALLQWRVLTGERTPAFYSRLAAIGLAIGLPLIAFGMVRNNAAGWPLTVFLSGAQWNYWGSILVSLGWMSLLVRTWLAGAATWLTRRLVAVGRMAFTCYIAETVICTTIFYGHGFGLFGRVDRFGQMLVVLGVWGVLLTIAPFWMALFRYGPLEWVWRTLTYGRVEPIARSAGVRLKPDPTTTL
jgi:uncharacterized protein